VSDEHPAGGLPSSLHRLFSNGLLGLLAVAAAILLAFWAYIAWGHGTFFDGYFANGAFQLLNPLRRIADGQLPGRDFLVFHGAGTVYLHLPVYLLFGQGLQAAEASRFLTSGLLHLAASGLFYSSLAKHVEQRRALICALVFFVAAPLVLDRIFYPQNSLLGVRSALPVMIGFALLAGWHWLLVAALTALAIFVSPENGVGSAAGLLALSIHALTLSFGEFLRVIRVLATALAGYCALVLATAGGHLAASLRYAFLSIPADQFWYFGVRPNIYLPVDWPELLHPGFYLFALLWLAALAAAVLLIRKDAAAGDAKDRRRSAAAIFLFVFASFATVSQLGYIFSDNLHGSERALLAVVLTAAATLAPGAAFPALALSLLVLLAAFGGGAHVTRELAAYSRPAVAWPEFLSPYWKQHLAAVQTYASNRSLWSAYAGLPEASRQTYPGSFDYVIHALGPEHRKSYVDAFLGASPAVVRLDNAHRWDYGWWLINSNWSFYREVFARYRLAYADAMATLWIRTAEDRDAPAGESAWERADAPPRTGAGRTIESHLEAECFTLRQSSQPVMVVEARVDYALGNPWQKVPLIGMTPRIVVFSTRPGDPGVSLPPPHLYGGSWQFPVVLHRDREVRFCTRVDSILPDVRITLRGASATEATVTDSARNYLAAFWRQ
jgi:hypothetical protein